MKLIKMGHNVSEENIGPLVGLQLKGHAKAILIYILLWVWTTNVKGEGGVYKGWNSQLAQWGAIIPTVQRAPGHFEYIYITVIMSENILM